MDTEETLEHHPFGPSTIGRLMNCLASHHLSKGEPNIESADSKDGTQGHEGVAMVIRCDPDYARGLTEEQRDAVDRCHDFADEVCPGPLRFLEERVELRDEHGVINFGTADFIGITDDKIVIIDWKFGRKIKEESLVLQVANYAAAAVQSIPEVRQRSHLPLEAWVFFPRTGTRLVWRATTGEEAIASVAPQIRQIIRDAENAEGQDPTPGNWCDYCRHLPNCKAVSQAAERDIAPATSDDLVDPARAIVLYDLSLVVEKQAKAVREKIRDLLLSNPDAIPGLQLRKRAGRRSVVDAATIKARTIGPEGLSVVEYMKACAPTVVALESAYVAKYYEGKGKGKVTQETLKKQFAELVGDMVKKTDSKVLTRV